MTETAAELHGAACLNCGHLWGEQRPRYCPDCGQESNTRAPTLAEFAHQFGGNYIAAEGALWRTLRLLLFKPGQLSREYIAGRRRHYVLPVRLYLTISLVVLLVVQVATQMKINAAPEVAQQLRSARSISMNLGSARAGVREGKFFCENLPDWMCRRLQRRFELEPSRIAGEVEAAGQRFFSHWGSAMFVLVPIFAAWVMLAYRNRRMRYAEHLVFALHLHAFWFIAALPGILSVPWVGDAAVLMMPLYALLAAQRVYGGRWWATVLRNAAVAVGYGMTLVLALGVVALWTFID